MATAQPTTDHDVIRTWVEERGGHPARVRASGSGEDPGILRIDFPGFSGEDTLEEIEWDEFFEWFDRNNLALILSDEGGNRFNKLVSRGTVKAGAGSRKRAVASRTSTTRKATGASSKKSASKKSASKKSAGTKKAGAKKAGGATKKSSAKSSASSKKSASSKTSAARRTAAKKGGSKSASKRVTSAKKASRKKASTKKASTKKATKKSAAKKAAPRKAAAKKAAPRKAAARKSSTKRASSAKAASRTTSKKRSSGKRTASKKGGTISRILRAVTGTSGKAAGKKRGTKKAAGRSTSKKGRATTGSSITTTNHDEIRSWVEARGGFPAHVKRTGKRRNDPGVLRIDYPGYSGTDTLERMDWDEWLDAFEANKLALVYQDKRNSRFSKLVAR